MSWGRKRDGDIEIGGLSCDNPDCNAEIKWPLPAPTPGARAEETKEEEA